MLIRLVLLEKYLLLKRLKQRLIILLTNFYLNLIVTVEEVIPVGKLPMYSFLSTLPACTKAKA